MALYETSLVTRAMVSGPMLQAVGHHAGNDLADVLDRALPAPAWRNEVTRPVELIVDLDKEIGKANRSHVRTHP